MAVTLQSLVTAWNNAVARLGTLTYAQARANDHAKASAITDPAYEAFGRSGLNIPSDIGQAVVEQASLIQDILFYDQNASKWPPQFPALTLQSAPGTVANPSVYTIVPQHATAAAAAAASAAAAAVANAVTGATTSPASTANANPTSTLPASTVSIDPSSLVNGFASTVVNDLGSIVGDAGEAVGSALGDTSSWYDQVSGWLSGILTPARSLESQVQPAARSATSGLGNLSGLVDFTGGLTAAAGSILATAGDAPAADGTATADSPAAALVAPGSKLPWIVFGLGVLGLGFVLSRRK